MLSLLHAESWSSPSELYEAPASAPLRSCAPSVISGRSAARLCLISSPSPSLSFCGHARKHRNAPSTVAFTAEVSSEAPERSQHDEHCASANSSGGNESNADAYDNGNGDRLPHSRKPGRLLFFGEELLVQDDDDGAEDAQSASYAAQKINLRLDALDMQKDFRGRQRPLLDVDTPPAANRSKPGKRQNVPKKARKVILTLRDLPVEEFAPALKKFKCISPDRADWVYVLRYFREKEDKSMLLEVFKFVLVLPAFKARARDYTNLIRVLVQLRNPEAVESTLKLMVKREVCPDLVTFTVVIGMYGKLGNLDMVNRKVEEMRLYQLQPDTIAYCAIIEAYCKMGYAVEAELLMAKMELEDLPINNQIFISLIKGYGNIGRVKDAERVFQLMQGKLFYPDRRSYSALMDAYSKDEDVRHATEVFNNMVAVGIEPTDKALARLLLLCEQKKMLSEAMEIVEKLERSKFKYGTNMLVSLKGWLAKLGLEEEVEQMSGELEKRLERKAYAARKWSMKAYLPASYCL